jgi:glycosyltransferase involved in cell wall biosynthesis
MTEKTQVNLNSRPKISVCMATHNGEQFVGLQLRSILDQLEQGDEIVVVDDASRDGTIAEIARLQDSRILLTENKTNSGVLRAFESALVRANGDIIFLSDQDDIWLPDKVKVVMNAFYQDPDLMLIASDAALIDDLGNRIGDSYYATRGRFHADLWRNLIVCRFLGCTMAFRSDLARLSLPFPRATQVHHDIWLGCVNAIMGGKILYLKEPLVEYRRHSTNFTGRVKFSWSRRIQMRAQLYTALLRFRLHSRGVTQANSTW